MARTVSVALWMFYVFQLAYALIEVKPNCHGPKLNGVSIFQRHLDDALAVARSTLADYLRRKFPK